MAQSVLESPPRTPGSILGAGRGTTGSESVLAHAGSLSSSPPISPVAGAGLRPGASAPGQAGTPAAAVPESSLHEVGEVQSGSLSRSVDAPGRTNPENGSPESERGLPAGRVRRLPVELAVVVPIREFRVRNLLSIAPGDVVATQWGAGEDLPLSSGDVQLAWTEFEVADTELAVRITRLA